MLLNCRSLCYEESLASKIDQCSIISIDKVDRVQEEDDFTLREVFIIPCMIQEVWGELLVITAVNCQVLLLFINPAANNRVEVRINSTEKCLQNKDFCIGRNL